MKSTKVTLMDLLLAAETPDALNELKEEALKGGYSYFNEFSEDLRDRIKHTDEDGMSDMSALLAKAVKSLPEPGSISPSWEFLWKDLEALLTYKEEALRIIPASERAGDWQIVMDNPFTNESVACYPSLTFLEAAYLYGYFRPGLKKNEYIRMQKIVSVLEHKGTDE
jgi:hypothetical protein